MPFQLHMSLRRRPRIKLLCAFVIRPAQLSVWSSGNLEETSTTWPVDCLEWALKGLNLFENSHWFSVILLLFLICAKLAVGQLNFVFSTHSSVMCYSGTYDKVKNELKLHALGFRYCALNLVHMHRSELRIITVRVKEIKLPTTQCKMFRI